MKKWSLIFQYEAFALLSILWLVFRIYSRSVCSCTLNTPMINPLLIFISNDLICNSISLSVGILLGWESFHHNFWVRCASNNAKCNLKARASFLIILKGWRSKRSTFVSRDKSLISWILSVYASSAILSISSLKVKDFVR